MPVPTALPLSRDDRRADARYHVRVPVVIHADGVKRLRRTVDLSCSGARIAYDPVGRHAPPDGPARVEIRRDFADPIQLIGVPMWRSSDSYGLKFLVSSEMDRLAIAELIDHERCLLYTSPSPRDGLLSRMPSSA